VTQPHPPLDAPHIEVVEHPTGPQLQFAGQSTPPGPPASPIPPGEQDQLEDKPERPKRQNPFRFTLIPRTLTARLVSGVVALVIVIVAITGTATYLSLSSYLGGRLDMQLAQTSTGPQVSAAISGRTNRFGQGNPTKVWLLELNLDGSVTNPQPPGITEMKLTTDQRRSALRRSTNGENQHPQSMITADGQSLRIVVVPLVNEGSNTQIGLVVVGLSTAEDDRTLSRLVLLELIIGTVSVLVAAGLTTWGVRVGLGPLKRVTRTAQEVTVELSPNGSGLDRRVPEMDSTTEVGQLATSFNLMLDTVEEEFTARRESEERMRQFLADASHELRTPLTSIRGYAELARMQKNRQRALGDPSVSDDEDTIGRIETEGTRMSRLVEDLLTLARGDDAAQQGIDHHELIDVGDVVVDAVSGVRIAHPNRVIVTDAPDNLSVVGDRDQLVRLLRNLTTNAAVHTDPTGPIRVSARREGDTVVMQVADSGPGLTPEEAAHVFERFWRADKARTRVRGGSGLGMSIVAQIVEAHCGRVYFDSSVPTGSTVTVVLPLS
jgi:two-component system OmpR family sensor kinase